MLSAEQLAEIGKIAITAVTLAATLRSMVAIILKARQNMAAIRAGADPKSLPPIDERPLVWAAVAAGALAYWFSQYPQLAQRVLPVAESAELTASASESVAQCTKASDCSSGCCDRGRCGCPKVDDQELVAAAAPLSRTCQTASECPVGCKCTGNQCTPCSAAKPRPAPTQKNQPRLVASIGEGTLCADCVRLPQLLSAIPQPFAD